MNQGKTAQEVGAMTPEQVVAASPVASVVSAAAGSTPAQPEITPATPPAPPVVRPAPGTGGITIQFPPRTVWTEKLVREEEQKIRDSVLKEEPFKQWQQSVGYQKTFEANANQVRNLSPAEQSKRNLNVVDLGLAESIIKLYDPQGVIREFKWEKFEKNQPRLDVLNAATDIYLKKIGSFTPGTRAELIKMGDEIVRGREEAAAPFVEKAIQQARSIPGAQIGNILTTEDARILANKAEVKKTLGAPAAAAVTGSIPPGAVVGTIAGRGRGYVDANGMWNPVR
jgi:hypothetical protein